MPASSRCAAEPFNFLRYFLIWMGCALRFSMKPSGTITAFLLDLLAVLPVEAEAEDVSEEAAPLDN